MANALIVVPQQVCGRYVSDNKFRRLVALGNSLHVLHSHLAFMVNFREGPCASFVHVGTGMTSTISRPLFGRVPSFGHFKYLAQFLLCPHKNFNSMSCTSSEHNVKFFWMGILLRREKKQSAGCHGCRPMPCRSSPVII
jgi:hypothetical protein